MAGNRLEEARQLGQDGPRWPLRVLVCISSSRSARAVAGGGGMLFTTDSGRDMIKGSGRIFSQAGEFATLFFCFLALYIGLVLGV